MTASRSRNTARSRARSACVLPMTARLSVYNAPAIFVGKHCASGVYVKNCQYCAPRVGHRVAAKWRIDERLSVIDATRIDQQPPSLSDGGHGRLRGGRRGVRGGAVHRLLEPERSGPRRSARRSPSMPRSSRTGQMLKVVWRGQPVFVVRRSKAVARRKLRDHDDLLADPNSTSSHPARLHQGFRAPRARAIPSTGSVWRSARTSAVRRSARSSRTTRSRWRAPISGRTGRADSIARATARSSTFRAGCSRACRRRRT